MSRILLLNNHHTIIIKLSYHKKRADVMLIHETFECFNFKQEIKWFYSIPGKISDGILIAYSQHNSILKSA